MLFVDSSLAPFAEVLIERSSRRISWRQNPYRFLVFRLVRIFLGGVCCSGSY
jgi:hypothetical protein